MAGRFGGTPRAAARAMLAGGLVHNVASDAHDVRRRPPGLTVGFDALDYVRKRARLRLSPRRTLPILRGPIGARRARQPARPTGHTLLATRTA